MLENLNPEERLLIGQCLRAAAEGPFFPEWEFDTLFGVSRTEVGEVARAWPNVDATRDVVILVVHNALTNLLGYPHADQAAWANYVGASREQVAHLLRKIERQ